MSLLKTALKKFLNNILSKQNVDNVIYFESLPDLSGNSYVLYKKMLKMELNKKYKIFWIVNQPEKFSDNKEENVFFVKKPRNKLETLKLSIKLSKAKLIITENWSYPKLNSKSFWLHLTHGTPIKNTKNYMYLDNNVNVVLYQSDYVKKIVANAHNVDESKLMCFGFPRNDLLISASKASSEEDYIVWLPTFRKQRDTNRIDSTHIHEFGVPILTDKNQVKKLNQELIKKNMKLYIKPHFASDLSNWDKIQTTNILIINDEFLSSSSLQLYEFLGKSKALITDYSSVYFDYAILNKPIALTIDDIEEYESNLGFVFKNYFSEIKGEYIKTFDDLEYFVENMPVKYNYEDINIKFNQYTDAESSERIINFLESKKLI